MNEQPRIDVERHLSVLKDFQRNTVEYLFKRMYLDPNPATRFLVADEVGLGKTLVARGLIAKAVDWLRQESVDRVDVVYVCSNAAIAAQNLARLNILEDDEDRKRSQTSYATRLTLLPIHVRNLSANTVNFISFTPGTTFNMRSNGGTVTERALIFWMIKRMPALYREGVRRLLRCAAGRKGWRDASQWWSGTKNLPDQEIAQRFRDALGTDESLFCELQEVAEEFRGITGDPADDLSSRRYALVGRLRTKLAQVCLDALEPDLVIMDEFQRFKHLLDPRREEARLAQQMFSYQHPEDPPPRVLLLSATPYKMYTASGDDEDQHYRDFIDTLRFLVNDEPAAISSIERALSDYRCAMSHLATSPRDQTARVALVKARDAIQSRLMQVMVRTERVSTSRGRNAMVREDLVHTDLRASDLRQAVDFDRVAQAAGARDIIEYWKSAPYLLNFMKGYDLQRRLSRHDANREDATQAPDAVVDALRAARPHMLPVDKIQTYKPVEPANGRLRALASDLFEKDLWAMLWVPPSLPYLSPQQAYTTNKYVSKTLVFSAWNLVPDVVAALSSYEAERRMMADESKDIPYDQLVKRRRGLLRFAVSGERFSGMGALLLAYPSPSLAALGDPLSLALDSEEQPRCPDNAIAVVRAQIIQRLREIGVYSKSVSTDRDPRWYWAAVAVMDKAAHPDVVDWLRANNGWRGLGTQSEEENEVTGFTQILDRFLSAWDSALALDLGGVPDDLPQVLAELAVGAPGVCSLRALGRLAPEVPVDDHQRLSGAARMADGFRTLFNVPESMGLLRSTDGEGDYWRQVARHGIAGNLQAVLDEQVHVLRESLGLVDASPTSRVEVVSHEIADTLSLRTASLSVNDVRVDSKTKLIHRSEGTNFRMRFGLRLGEFRDEHNKVKRADVVRRAFNSPFRPFLLTSTSVGQEGLDFHTWCHTVVHWNLPGNPVDMEQREGRVHRYKGHAIRKNVAERFGLSELSKRSTWDRVGDPWQRLFELAREHRDPARNDLVPYWLYDEVDEPVLVDRKVIMLPFSRETERYEELKKSLALYRLAFGQPRQEELIHWLKEAIEDFDPDELSSWQISLQAPVISP